MVRVLPDVAGLGKLGRTFDYLVPPELDPVISVGALVRVSLHGRRVGGWVVADDVEPPAGVSLQPLARFSSIGPSPGLVDLASWASWRWAGRQSALLRAASPVRAVRVLPQPRAQRSAVTVPTPPDDERVAREALAAGQAIVRYPPAHDSWPLIAHALLGGSTIVVTPSADQSARLATRMRRAGVAVAQVPEDWSAAATGAAAVVGARGAVWAPCPDLAAIVVVDAHDEALIEDRAPAWSAWVVAAERARRAGVPCLLISPAPTLEHLAWGALVVPSRSVERHGWPAVTVVDRRADDPRTGLFSPAIVPLVRSATLERPVVCVLNRKGRARLLSCAVCRDVAVCERCHAAVEVIEATTLHCRACGSVRPVICLTCGAGRMKALRPGVARVREELEALVGVPVVSITAETGEFPPATVFVGTEAVLRRVPIAGAVIFLDLDAELLAPRYHAGEQALALLARAARLVGRREGGIVVVQTRQPNHPVVISAVRADPSRLAEADLAVRQALTLPPLSALAQLSGEGASEFASAITGAEVLGPDDDGRWLVRAPDHATLCDALAAVVPPTGRIRVDVDPQRI